METATTLNRPKLRMPYPGESVYVESVDMEEASGELEVVDYLDDGRIIVLEDEVGEHLAYGKGQDGFWRPVEPAEPPYPSNSWTAVPMAMRFRIFISI